MNEGGGVQRKTILPSRSFGRLLVEKGIVPPTTRRVIIDCRLDTVVILYTEQFADDRLLDEELARMLVGGQ